MLKLSTAKREPEWLDASNVSEGVRFLLAPITPAMILAARSAGSGAVLDGVSRAKAGEPGNDAEGLEGKGEAAFTRSLVQAGMRGWEGVGDADGTPINPSPDAIDALLSDWRFFRFLDQKYINPGLAPAAEKNASSPSRNGTSGAKTRAKRIAKTARKPAKPAHTG